VLSSTLVDDRLEKILELLLARMSCGPKEHQINMLKGLKSLIDNYIEDDDRIDSLLMPRLNQFVQYLVNSKCFSGIRLSIFESVFRPKKQAPFVKALVSPR
jgi:hypothetical protein